MTLPSAQRLYQATNTTWPARRTRQEAGWEIRDGAGGGKRVSAVTLAQKELPDIDWIEATLTAQGQEHLFMIRDGDEALDASLAAVKASKRQILWWFALARNISNGTRPLMPAMRPPWGNL